MPVKVKITTFGLTKLFKKFAVTRSFLRNMQSWLSVAGELVIESIHKNQFIKGGTPKWRRLSKSTTVRRQYPSRTKGRRKTRRRFKKPGGQARPLRDTGFLMNSIIRAMKHATFSIWDMGKQTLEIGTNRPGAASHQYGTKDGHVPARPFLRILKRDEENMTTAAAAIAMRPYTK